MALSGKIEPEKNGFILLFPFDLFGITWRYIQNFPAEPFHLSGTLILIKHALRIEQKPRAFRWILPETSQPWGDFPAT